LTPIEFNKPTGSGRTRPAIVTCETAEGDIVEVVAKFSAGCDLGVTSLAREVVAACLAADLELPVPQPFLLEISPDWANIIVDAGYRELVARSSRIAFGSKYLGNQYTAWSSGTRLLDDMVGIAAAAFVFDCIIQNPDRRLINPNCLVRGDEIRIIDHELAFAHGQILFWRPPWQLGGLNVMETPGFHIFRDVLRNRNIDFEPIGAAWRSLSDDRLRAYGAAVPGEWSAEGADIDSALALIRDARDNIDGCIAEARRVLE
jgi:hypothetical protein